MTSQEHKEVTERAREFLHLLSRGVEAGAVEITCSGDDSDIWAEAISGHLTRLEDAVGFSGVRHEETGKYAGPVR